MEILQWLDAAFRVVSAGALALLPGLIFWLTVLGFYLLIQWIGNSDWARTLSGRDWTTGDSSRQISQGKG